MSSQQHEKPLWDRCVNFWHRTGDGRSKKANDTSTKLYIVIINGTPKQAFDIDSFFKGEQDRFYMAKDRSNTPSVSFEECKIFTDLSAAQQYGARNSDSMGQAYVLVSPYAKDKLIALVAAGQFSKSIESAYPCKQLGKSVAQNNPSDTSTHYLGK